MIYSKINCWQQNYWSSHEMTVILIKVIKIKWNGFFYFFDGALNEKESNSIDCAIESIDADNKSITR